MVHWSSPSVDSVRTLDGTILHLDTEAPKSVLRFLFDDFHTVFAANTSTFEPASHDGPAGGYATRQEQCGKIRYATHDGKRVPWFESAAAVIGSKWASDTSAAAIASASSLPEGGWWTQARLFAKGLAADPVCRLCNEGVGGLAHRMFGCPRKRDMVDLNCPKFLAKAAYTEADNPLFTSGVPLRPECPKPPPAIEAWVGHPPPTGAVASGVAYTDGSLNGSVPKARRAGWAYIVDDSESPPWGKYGTCHEQCPTVLRAELRALVEILRITVGPLDIFVDNAEVVEGVQRGRAWGCNPKRDGADLWRQVWDRLDEIGPGVRVCKVKAHLTFQDVLGGRIPWSNWIGNGIADAWAKAACDYAMRTAPTQWIHAEWHKACTFYRWAVRIAAEWRTDTEPTQPVDTPKSVPAPRPRRKRQLSADHRPHEIWRSRNHAWCRACGIHCDWTTGGRPTVFARSCAGTLGARCGIAGREHAVPLARLPSDDGIVPLAALHGAGAELWCPSTGQTGSAAGATDNIPAALSHSPRGGHAGGVATETVANDELQPTSFENFLEYEDEHDPFGNAYLGFDDGDAPSGTVQSSSRAPSVGQPSSSTPSTGAHASHHLRRTGNVIWCRLCGRHAAIRLGIGLIRPCRGAATGCYPSRIARLQSGQHPVTGVKL